MLPRRERKHAHVEVTGDVPLDDALPRWEAELIIAAPKRMADAPAAREGEPDHADAG